MQFLPPSLCAPLHKMRERERERRACVCERTGTFILSDRGKTMYATAAAAAVLQAFIKVGLPFCYYVIARARSMAGS